MQTASQKAFKPKRALSVRTQTIRAIHATWRKVCFDLEDDELRDARIAFINNTLKFDPPIESMRDKRMTGKRLGHVLDEMRVLERGNLLPFERLLAADRRPAQQPTSVDGHPSPEAEIHHLATNAQVEVIQKLIQHLAWSAIGKQAFLTKNFRRESERMLTPAQANSCTYILLRIAAAKSIKQTRNVKHVSSSMIREEIPKLKERLGIDQKAVGRKQEAADEEDFDEVA